MVNFSWSQNAFDVTLFSGEYKNYAYFSFN